MAMLSTDVPALVAVRPRASAFRLSKSQPIQRGDFQVSHYGGGEASTMSYVMQVVGSSSFPARNGSCTLRHLSHMPEISSSKDEHFNACKTFMGSIYHYKGREHASVTTQKSVSSFVCRMQSSQSSEWEREEARWLREEKRWIREEERWLREEARWASEHKDLLEQIAALKMEIAKLESQVKEEVSKDGMLSGLIVSLTSLLQSLNTATSPESGSRSSSFQAQISSSSSSSTDLRTAVGSTVGMPIKNIEVVTAVSQPSIVELKTAPTRTPPSYESRKTLKRGAEGADVKALQEALAKLGFFSGDDDMEYSTFSTGTDRAVRSWQATLGASEDGIVTAELLKKLLSEEPLNPSGKKPSLSSSSPEGKETPSAKIITPTSTPGSPDGKLRTSEVKVKTSTSPGSERAAGFPSPKKAVNANAESSRPRVYLLGENRWEEPARLLSKNGPTATAVTTGLGEKCFSCKGQGCMMCTECEGTGELNVEEQFLEWADEGAKCPYCEGSGMIDCDVCAGKGVTTTE